MLRLEEELPAAGCKVEVDDFRAAVNEMFTDVFPNWTDEDLLCRPQEAIRFCNLIRECVECAALEDYVILRTLTNVRKSSGRILNGSVPDDSQRT